MSAPLTAVREYIVLVLEDDIQIGVRSSGMSVGNV